MSPEAPKSNPADQPPPHAIDNLDLRAVFRALDAGANPNATESRMTSRRGSTWARNVRALNKSANAHDWHQTVATMSVDDWEKEVMNLGMAGEVLLERAPAAVKRACELNDKFCVEDNAPAAVMLARGMVLLAAILRTEPVRDRTDVQS